MSERTSLGSECIRFAEDVLNIELMPWQKWFLIHALELHPTDVGSDGAPLFRFRKVILLVGRQNGKSTVMQALTLWRMFVDRCNLVIGTAQDLEVAESLLKESYELAEEVPELKSAMMPMVRGAGKMSFRLDTGETYKVKAVSRRGGRGLSGQLVLLDELREHQSWEAWAAVTKTTNAQERAQIYGISNAGDATSIVLRYLRKMAHDELGDPDSLNVSEAPEDLLADDEEIDDSALGVFEWSARPGAPINDRDAWAQSNPALGHRIRESTLASDAKTDPEWVFRTEVLCQWSDGSLEGPFPPGAWDAGIDLASTIAADSPLSWCVDVSMDRTRAVVFVAGYRPDSVPHVENAAERAGLDWVPGWFAERAAKAPMSVVVQGRGAPASSLIDDLEAIDGVTVVPWGGAELGNGTARLYDAVTAQKVVDGVHQASPGVFHLPWPSLDVAAATAVPKILEGGAVVWDRRKSPTDISPLMAATGALWGLAQYVAPKRSKYEDEDLVMA